MLKFIELCIIDVNQEFSSTFACSLLELYPDIISIQKYTCTDSVFLQKMSCDRLLFRTLQTEYNNHNIIFHVVIINQSFFLG